VVAAIAKHETVKLYFSTFRLSLFHYSTKTAILTQQQRFYSLDVFRGATVALMILVNNPGSWAHIYGPLAHAPWHGCTPTDLVFPFFLFAVGNALSFVMPRLETAGTSVFLRKVLTRSMLIFGIGLFLNWSPFVKWSGDELVFKYWVEPKDPNSGIRILGVLQRIALSYFFASLIIYFFKIRGALFTSIILLFGYWVLCLMLGNQADPFSLAGYFGTDWDLKILHKPHMYKGEGVPFDPEGFASTITSTVQVIFGYFVGYYIQQKSKAGSPLPDNEQTPHNTRYEMLAGLFVGGCVLIFSGFAWDTVFPINKKIWTSSYVLYTVGLAILVLGCLLYLIEYKRIHEQKGFRLSKVRLTIIVLMNFIIAFIPYLLSDVPYYSALTGTAVTTFFLLVIGTNNLARFFDVFGKNALFIFFISSFLPRLLALFRWVDHKNEDGKPVYTSLFPWFYQHVCKPVSSDPKIGSLLYALSLIIFFWLIVYWMDKKKIYIKV
jgi:predicted acyltransferase